MERTFVVAKISVKSNSTQLSAISLSQIQVFLLLISTELFDSHWTPFYTYWRLWTTAAQYAVSLLLQAFISLSTQIRSRSLPNMFLSLGFDACREDWVEHFVYGRLSVDFTEFYRYKVWNQETVMVFKHATIQCMSSWWNKTLYFARYVSPILLWLKCGAGDVLHSRGQG